MAEQRVVGGVVNAHRTLQECQQEAALRERMADLEGQRQQLFALTRELEQCRQAEVEAAEWLDRVRDDPAERGVAEARVAETRQASDDVEKRRDLAGRRLHDLRVHERELAEHFAAREEEETRLGELRVQNEKRAAKRILRARRAELEEVIVARQEEKRSDAAKLSSAEQERERAQRRVNAKRKEKQRQLEQLQQAESEAHRARTQAVLGLKRSTAKIQGELQGKNAKREARERAQANREQEEFNHILEAGGNPYEVFRRRKMNARIDAAKARIQQKLKQSQLVVAQKMIAFDDYVRRKDEELAREKAYEERYTNSLGRAVQEDVVRRYMQSRTIGGVESVDPTGRQFRVQPSQVTTIKSHAFGLGKVQRSRGDIVDMVAANPGNKGVQPNLKLVPARLRAHLPEAQGERGKGATPSPSGSRSAAVASLARAALPDKVFGLLEGDERAQAPGASLEPEQAAEAQNERQLVAALPDNLAAASGKASNGRNARGSKAYQLRELSALELRSLEEARKRQLQNVVQDQVVWGKRYEGSAFLAKPSVLHFKDFEVGAKYKKTFVLTNVSYTFNDFKVLDLPNSVKNFFTVTYDKPGRMSAGLTCRLEIEFEPKVNEDISVDLPFLASTGKFAVPIRCTKRTVSPELSTSCVAFSTTVIGERKTATLTITNRGALDAAISLTGVPHAAAIAAAAAAEAEEGLAPARAAGAQDLLIEEAPSVLKGYSSATVVFSYAPTRASAERVEHELTVSFSNPVFKCASLSCRVEAACTDVPIYVDCPALDFQCCVFDKLYRNVLVLKNRGHVAMRAQVGPPKGFADALEFLPGVGFVQGRNGDTDGRFEVQIKFRPSRALFDKCVAKGMGDRATGMVSIPLTITVPDQVLPVEFRIEATLTHSEVEMSSKTVDFGMCYTNQSVTVPLQMHNCSMLAQRFGFVKLKPQLDVQPAHGFGTLLPEETCTRELVFSPTAATDYSFSLQCRTDLNRQFVISCKGRGLDPPLQLSHTIIAFAATSVGARARQSIFLSNPSSEPRTFHIVGPDATRFGHGISVSPLVGTLQPGGRTRVEVEFLAAKDHPVEATTSPATGDNTAASAPETEGEQDEPTATAKSKAKSKGEAKPTKSQAKGGAKAKQQERDEKAAEEEEGAAPTEEEKTQAAHGAAAAADADAAVVLRRTIPPEIGSEELSKTELNEPWSKHCEWVFRCFVAGFDPPLLLKVSTVTIAAEVVCDEDHLDFEQVAVGHSQTLVLRVRNFGKSVAKIRTAGLSPIGPFSIVNATRDIPANESHAMSIKFHPEGNRKYRETLTLICKNGSLEVDLNGQGVSPELELLPPEGEPELQRADGLYVVDFGDVLQGERCARSLRLRNKSVFGLEYGIEQVSGTLLPVNFDGLEVFSIAPQEARIAAGESSEVVLEFAPDQELLGGHCGFYEVNVPNQVGEHRLVLRGRCWSTALFAFIEGGSVLARDAVVDEFAGAAAAEAAAAAAPAAPFTCCAVLDEFEDLCVEVVVGSCSASKGGSYELVNPPAALQIDKPKGTLKAGTRESVRIKVGADDPRAVGEHELVCKLSMDGGGTREVRFLLRKMVVHVPASRSSS